MSDYLSNTVKVACILIVSCCTDPHNCVCCNPALWRGQMGRRFFALRKLFTLL